MTLRTFRDFSFGEQGYVDEDGIYEEFRINSENLETFPVSGALYVFDYSKRIEETQGQREIDLVEEHVVSPKSFIYRIISSSEKAQTATGVEIQDLDKKKTLCNKIKDQEIARQEREYWETCQGWRRE